MRYRTGCLCVFLLMAFTSSAQKKTTRIVPPGTVKVNDTLFIDKYEISNVAWREYLFFQEQYDSLNVEKALPDTLVWSDTAFYELALSEYYFRHPSFNSYPLVGVSYDQALAFCRWRTFACNFKDYCRHNEITNWKEHLKDTFPIKYYFRLPAKNEWESIAAGSLNPEKHPYGYDSVKRKWKGKYVKIFNCHYPEDTVIQFSHFGGRQYTANTISYYPNSSKAYCMIGNVAEMVAEKGIAKGGSFAHRLEDCAIRNDQFYNQPACWLGFRCVAVVLKQ